MQQIIANMQVCKDEQSAWVGIITISKKNERHAYSFNTFKSIVY